MYTNLALSLLPYQVGAAVPEDGWWCTGTLAHPPEVRSCSDRISFLVAFLLGSRGGVEDWKGDEQKMPQSRPHPGSPHPLSIGPRLPRLCRNRTKALAKDGWEGRLDAFRLVCFEASCPLPRWPGPLQKGSGFPCLVHGARSRSRPLPGSSGSPLPIPGRPAAGHDRLRWWQHPRGMCATSSWNFREGEVSPAQSRLPPTPEAGWAEKSGRSAGSPLQGWPQGCGQNCPVPSGSGSRRLRNRFSS